MATQAEHVRSDADVLSTAVVRVAGFWGLSNAKLAMVLGLSPRDRLAPEGWNLAA